MSWVFSHTHLSFLRGGQGFDLPTLDSECMETSGSRPGTEDLSLHGAVQQINVLPFATSFPFSTRAAPSAPWYGDSGSPPCGGHQLLL